MLVALAAAAGGGCMAKSAAMEDLEPRAHLPFVSRMPTNTLTATATTTSTPTATATATVTATVTATGTPPSPPTGSRVVHVHSEEATFWGFSTGWYGDYVNQDAVNSMVDEGLKQLTGRSTVTAAWQTLLPGYAPGKTIAIKVNFNNSMDDCTGSDNVIDALIEPVNALVRGMKDVGVREEDIWVYDAIRRIPDRFVNGCQYPIVQFFDDGACRNPSGWTHADPRVFVSFFPPPGIPVPSTVRITALLTNATYLINMPIMKCHGLPGVTLGFKNHLGTVDSPGTFHDYLNPSEAFYSPDYSPLVDLYLNSLIGGRTVLTLGDGLFAAPHHNQAPRTWATFGDGAPDSLFLSTDPVAVDCVMCDLLAAEFGIPGYADNYLRLAADAGLGVFERGDPWGSGYSQVDYVKVEL